MDDPTNETVFEFPSTVSLYLLPAVVVGSVLILFVIMTPFSPNNLAVVLLVILVVAIQLIFFSRLRYRVAVSDDGIRYMPDGCAPIFLRWSEVASLELRESIRGRLVMSDAARLRTIAVDYQLGRFEQLLSIVVDRATNCDPHLALPKSFHSSYLDQVIVIAVFLICAGFSIWFAHFGQSLNAAAFGLFTLLPLGIFVFLPHSLTVSSDSISLGHLGWRREIAIGSITGVRFGVQTGSRGASWTVVWVDLAGREPLKLTGFTEGSLAVYYALRDARRPMKDSGMRHRVIQRKDVRGT